MRFVDLNTGAIYNGDAPYIHWFDDEQSTNLVYLKKLCVISEDEYINIELNSTIFSLLNMDLLPSSNNEIINEFTYKDISQFKTNHIKSTGFEYNGYYLHMIYISSQSKNEGEFLDDLYINDKKYIVGSSFYDKYEPNKINLSNLGVDIPESFSRSIYPTNIHEDEIDNIVVNRKYKELLNEYWNIVANKGSYKSLYNSLSWFEYGDLIKIQELWENKDKYNQQDIRSHIDIRVKDYLCEHKKTTYLGLYLSLQQLNTDENGDVTYPALINEENYNGFIREENPELSSIASKWSNEDLCLKMYLVGNFFETYFMPIHLDLIHSTVENIVFANTIKIIRETRISREDYFNNFFTFNCNVDNGSTFFLDDVNVQVGKDTIAGVQWDENIKSYDSHTIIGVDKNVPSVTNDKELKTFMMQYYNGIGSVIKFECDVDLQLNDFIKALNINIIYNNDIVSKEFKLLVNRDNAKHIVFYILCKYEGQYKMNISFNSSMGFNYIKSIDFSILDNTSKNLKIYKVKYNTKEEHNDKTKYLPVTDYMFAHNNNSTNKDKTYFYIPEYIQELNNDELKLLDNIFLHKTIIVNGSANLEDVIQEQEIRENTEVLYKYKYEYINTTKKYIKTDEITYTIFILPTNTPIDYEPNIDKKRLVRNDYVFYPEKHHLEEINTNTLDDYTFTQNDVLMVVPNSKYLKYIEDPEWEFENISMKNNSLPIKLRSIKTPFIANTNYKLLDPGFYNIKFRYKLGQTIQEISLDSAFRIV